MTLKLEISFKCSPGWHSGCQSMTFVRKVGGHFASTWCSPLPTAVDTVGMQGPEHAAGTPSWLPPAVCTHTSYMLSVAVVPWYQKASSGRGNKIVRMAYLVDVEGVCVMMWQSFLIGLLCNGQHFSTSPVWHTFDLLFFPCSGISEHVWYCLQINGLLFDK